MMDCEDCCDAVDLRAGGSDGMWKMRMQLLLRRYEAQKIEQRDSA